MKLIPKRLKQAPLIEAIWQVQFEPTSELPVGDLLPGMLYAALRGRYPKLQLQRLPTADIPASVSQIDPNLRHMAKFCLEDPESTLLFQIGDRVITLNSRYPYIGWNNFKAEILALIQVIEQSQLVPTPLQHALRYIDLLTIEPAPNLSALQLSLRLGGFNTQAKPLQMRIELPDGDYLHVVQIATPAQATLPHGTQSGTIVDLETSCVGVLSGWDTIKTQIEPLHERLKALFFENILTPEAIARMEPEY